MEGMIVIPRGAEYLDIRRYASLNLSRYQTVYKLVYVKIDVRQHAECQINGNYLHKKTQHKI